MTYKLRRADIDDDDDCDTLKELHILCFGDTAPVWDFESGGWWWIMSNNREPVGFAGIVESTYYPKAAYLTRTGIVPWHRGRGLSRRIFPAIERQARKLGLGLIVSDTTANAPSANGFIGAGYQIFDPEYPWSFPTATYWRKYLG